MQEEVLKIEELAKKLQVSVSSIERLMPELPHLKIGRINRFLFSSVVRFLEELGRREYYNSIEEETDTDASRRILTFTDPLLTDTDGRKDTKESSPPSVPPSLSPTPSLVSPPCVIINPPSKKTSFAPNFETFWRAYPKKKGKGAAIRAFSRVKVPIETLIAAIEEQKTWESWTKNNGEYIPHPGPWLNNRRWEDEPDVRGPTWTEEFLAQEKIGGGKT